MKKAKHLLGFLSLTAFGLFLFPNNVDAAKIESSNDLKIVFEAHDATVDGKTVKLNKNIEDTEIYEIGGDDYVIDLNGYKFTTEKIYIKTGTLTINDSKGNSEIDTTGDCFNVESGAKLIINNSKIDYLVNAGNTIINNANIEDLINEGTMTIKTGTFDNLNQKGTSLTINGGTFGPTIVELDKGKTTIAGIVEFKAEETDEEDIALKLISETTIDEKAINQIIGDGFIAAFSSANIDDFIAYDVVKYYDKIYVLEEETESMETIFNKIAPNGVWTVNSFKPNKDQTTALLNAILEDFKLSLKYSVRVHWHDSEDEQDPENVTLHIEYTESPGSCLKQKTVKVIYNEPSDEIKASVNSVLSKIENKLGDFSLGYSNMDKFVLEDLYLINYLNASTKGMDPSLQLNFAKDLIELTNGANMSYKYQSVLGGGSNYFSKMSAGPVYVLYNGIITGTTKMAFDTNNIIYVPSNTANTDEARIDAALKRIENYLGTTKGITITVGGALESLSIDLSHFGDDKSLGTNYYNVTINGETYKFLICMKDAKDLEIPSYLASDILTDISIKSNSAELPLDTAITVKSVTSDEIKKVLGTSIYAAYDISLYSNAKQVNITKLENGKFTVNIPVSENLKGKDIIVYYINSNGKKEPYTATLSADGKSVSFETNHFSTYALVEKLTEENPQTFDGISNGMLIGAISFIGFFGAVIYFNKRNKIASH